MDNRVLKIHRGIFLFFVMTMAAFPIVSRVSASDFLKKEHSTIKESNEKGVRKSKENHVKDTVKKTKEHAIPSGSATHEGASAPGAEEGLKRLTEGNKRYLAGKMVHKGQNAARRAETATEQHPFAVVLSCSDSRVPPEVIFDQGLGDLFVVRTAGQVADDAAIGSIEYAVEHLGVRLVVVLGHKRCGAVEATVKGGETPGRIGRIVEAIKPAVEKAKEKHGDLLDDAVKANIKIVARQLRASKPFLAEAAEDGMLKIVGSYYDLDTGAVSLTYKPCM